MTLEALDVSDLGDVFVRYPVDLERWMMEGAYNKVYRAREHVPRQEYTVLLDRLMGTIREQIALTIETSYPSLPLQNAAQLLFFKSGETTQLVKFATEVSYYAQNRPQLTRPARMGPRALDPDVHFPQVCDPGHCTGRRRSPRLVPHRT
jgi:26S proteasome regulatory subunit N12